MNCSYVAIYLGKVLEYLSTINKYKQFTPENVNLLLILAYSI